MSGACTMLKVAARCMTLPRELREGEDLLAFYDELDAASAPPRDDSSDVSDDLVTPCPTKAVQPNSKRQRRGSET